MPSTSSSPSPLGPAPLPPNLKAILTNLVTPRHSLPSLTSLYTSIHFSLPSVILARSPSPHLTLPDLVRIMESKLSFGQNRPALRAMIASLSPSQVGECSTKAFAALSSSPSSSSKDRISSAITALIVLKGVGPATASLILSLVCEEVPFFSDEAAVEALKPVGGRKGLKYTIKEYWEFFEVAGKKSEGTEGGRRGWERGVWAGSVLKSEATGESAMKEGGEAREKKQKRKSAGGEEEMKGEVLEGGRPKRMRTAAKKT